MYFFYFGSEIIGVPQFIKLEINFTCGMYLLLSSL